MKIGIFDSGLGGLTVMREIISLLPEEDLVYFGDTARVPYGNKSADTVIRYAHEISNFLMDHDIKLLVIACNTASAYALQSVQEQLPIPVIGVIEPGAAQAISVSKNQKIAVLGTRSTIQSGAYQAAIQSRSPVAQVIAISCPLFVPLVEEDFLHHEATRLVIREYLSPMDTDVDTVLLGCTHYPLMKEQIQAELINVTLVDSATTCAQRVKQVLVESGQLNEKRASEPQFFVSDDPDRFHQMSRQFLGNMTLQTGNKVLMRSFG